MKNSKTLLYAAAFAAALLFSGRALGATPAGGSGTGSAPGFGPSGPGAAGTPSAPTGSTPGFGSAGSPTTAPSGGPGTLGTEVPLDSRTAESYYHSQLRVSGQADRRIHDDLQKLLSDNQAALDAAKRVAQGSDPKVQSLAQKFADQRQADDNTLVRVAQDSGFAVPGSSAFSTSSGPGSGGPSDRGTSSPAPSASASASTGSSASGSSSSSSASSDAFSELQSAAQNASKTANDLMKAARKQQRYALASAAEQTKNAIDRDLKDWQSSGVGSSNTGGSSTNP